jgi:hypothetical protein
MSIYLVIFVVAKHEYFHLNNSLCHLFLAPPHLEKVLREQIADGQPRTHRPWKKIIVVVEGIYSMEGELCQLPEIVAICKKYKVIFFMVTFFIHWSSKQHILTSNSKFYMFVENSTLIFHHELLYLNV